MTIQQRQITFDAYLEVIETATTTVVHSLDKKDPHGRVFFNHWHYLELPAHGDVKNQTDFY